MKRAATDVVRAVVVAALLWVPSGAWAQGTDTASGAGLRDGAPEVSLAHLKDAVSVRDFGATGDGATDDTRAIRDAIATGKTVHFPAGVYLLTEQISTSLPLRLVGASPRTAKVRFYRAQDPNFGGAFASTGATGSLIASIGFVWGQTPWTVEWDYALPNWWTSTPTVGRNRKGCMANPYHPATVWDPARFPGMDHQQGMYIALSQSGGLACGILVDNVYGEFLSIRLAGVRDSVVQHCHLVGTGPATTGGIEVWNYDSNRAGLERGSNITVQNCRIENAANNGINLAGADDCVIAHNWVSRGGESGIKTYQSGPAPDEDPSFQCNRIAVIGNHVSQMWDTGLDLTHTYPVSDGPARRLRVIANRCWNNRMPGINTSGSECLVASNECTENGADGIRINGSRNLIVSNRCRNNNLREEATGRHELTVALGGENQLLFNSVRQTTVHGGNLGLWAGAGNVVVAP